jgi:hypothetical protein
MARRDPRESRVLGLWTAAWLAVLLLAGLLWLGDLSLQWPVLAVPVVWALVALRPRHGSGPPAVAPPGYRSDTVERPAIRPPDPRR